MSGQLHQFDDLHGLLIYLVDDQDDQLDSASRSRLVELLRNDPVARRNYLQYILTDAMLRLEFTAPLVAPGQLLERSQGSGVRGQSLGFGVRESENANPESQIPNQLSCSESPAPPIILDLSTPLHSPLSPLPSFVGGLVFSYMVATVIVGMMLLGAWAYKITHYQQIVEKRSPSINQPEMQFVGQITGMVDCRWSDPQTETYPGASVPLGRRFALASGLMEITYDSGAKVILQGPCTYEAESRAGGFLSLGKLTAKVVSGQWPVASAKPQAANPKSQIPNQQISNPQSLIPNPFFVRTPTAIVTDLGTEFGVEVSEDGNTISHVFRGSVKVQVVGGDDRREGLILRENESARVEKKSGKPSITRRGAGEASRFMLAMPPPKSVRDSEAYAKLVLSLKPVVYYRMERLKDEKNRGIIFDSAPGGHHGELRLGNEFGGSPYLPGRFGHAISLRGPAMNDRVIVPDYPKATNDQLTVSAWVLATGRPGWAMIACNWASESGPGDVGQFHVCLYRLDGDLRVKVTLRDGQHVEAREGASHSFPLFVWQHVAFVADGSSLHLYRNGKQVASSPCAGILPQPPTPRLGIGCKLNNQTGTDAMLDTPGWNFWQGRIDELAIFNQALSAETIQTLYLGKPLPDQTEATQTQKPPKEADL